MYWPRRSVKAEDQGEESAMDHSYFAGPQTPRLVGVAKAAPAHLERGTQDSNSLLSETPLSLTSTPPTESGLDERKAKIIDGIVLHLQGKIRQVFAQARIRARGGQHETPAESSQARHSTPTSTIAGKSDSTNRNGKKRKMDDRDFGDDEDDDADLFRPKQAADRDKVEDSAYACPYFKYNPAMYKSARNCPGPGWPTVHRVK